MLELGALLAAPIIDMGLAAESWTADDSTAARSTRLDSWPAADGANRQLEEEEAPIVCVGVTAPIIKPTAPTLVDANNLGNCKCATSTQPGYR